jgi:hypothetical protein
MQEIIALPWEVLDDALELNHVDCVEDVLVDASLLSQLVHHVQMGNVKWHIEK